MTTRVQIIRSSTPGAVPAAGTRSPGELWTTFPDLQLGVIDASKTAQRLVAVRYFSTQANYAVGDFVVQAGALYVANTAVTAGAFNSGQWVKIQSASDLATALGAYLPLSGGTLTGPLLLAADPGAALGAATKQYVDGKVTAAPYLLLAGGVMTGPVILSGSPTIPLHAATKAYVDSGAFVPIGGGTMTGDLILNRDAQVALGAATKEQVDARGAGDNRIINGDMRIDQRGGAALNGYTVDRWWIAASAAGKLSWIQNTASGAPGFPNHLGVNSISAYTPAATEQFTMYQAIEADMISDFQWGTANAQPVTLSFWAYSSLTGTFSGSFKQYGVNRSYPFTFALPIVGWTKIAVTIPGDTGSNWVMSSNAGSLLVQFDLGSGSNFRGSANAWANVNYTGATGAVSIIGTNGATFFVTGVKLEIGSVATPYNRQSLAKSMADCQRYYFVGNFNGSGNSSIVSGYAGWSWALSVLMRAAPTLTPTFTTTLNISGAAINLITANATGVSGTTTAAGNWALTGTYTASAEL